MAHQSRAVRRIYSAEDFRLSHQAMATKKGSASIMRRKSRVTGLTGWLSSVGTAYASLIQIGRKENASTPARANAIPQAR